MRIKDQVCTGPACPRRAVVRDRRTGLCLCKAHYQQLQVRPAAPLRALQSRRERNGGCTEPGCAGAHYALGLCRPAYMRHWRRRRSAPQKELA